MTALADFIISPECVANEPRAQRALASHALPRRSMNAAPVLFGLVMCAGMLGGCATEPWVKPYERERLADPIMQFSRNALSEKHFEHVRDVREGARGATGVQGGGCGCN